MGGSVVTDDLWRSVTPQVIGALVRRYRDFDRAEDAAQEALFAAAAQWPEEGVPDDPKAWLIRVGSRRLIDGLRSDEARARRELADATRAPADTLVAPPPYAVGPPDHDDTLTLLLLCCHPALAPPARIALTLRAVGGLTTAQIAHAFLVPEATMAQRISRAKKQIRDSGAEFRMPPPDDVPDRLREVLHVLYLVFTEGHTASTGDALHRVDLTAEAIRLTRQVARPPARRRRGGRTARPDAAHRGAAPGPHERRPVSSCRSPSRTAHGGTRHTSARASPS